MNGNAVGHPHRGTGLSKFLPSRLSGSRQRTRPSKPWQAKPEQQGPDIDPVPTQAPELSSYEDEQPDADAGAPPEHSVEPEELRSGDADRFAKTNAERSIRSRLFPRLTH